MHNAAATPRPQQLLNAASDSSVITNRRSRRAGLAKAAATACAPYNQTAPFGTAGARGPRDGLSR
jgi:hypothetical protein